MFDGVIGTILCKLEKVAWSIFITVSILSMVSIAVDRVHAVRLVKLGKINFANQSLKQNTVIF